MFGSSLDGLKEWTTRFLSRALLGDEERDTREDVGEDETSGVPTAALCVEASLPSSSSSGNRVRAERRTGVGVVESSLPTLANGKQVENGRSQRLKSDLNGYLPGISH